MQNIPDVADMFELKSYDELSKIINDWLNEDSDSEDSDGTERSGASNASTGGGDKQSTDTESSSYKSLDDAFADLME